MDDQSWKGHNLTLLIFGAVVVLCSIFFILGMLAGRSEAPAVVEVEAIPEATLPEEEAADLDLRFYEAVEDGSPPPLEVSVPEGADSPEAGAPSASVPTEFPPPPPFDGPEPEPGLAITLQIAALGNPTQAETLRRELAEKGFPSFIVDPDPNDQPALHRIQVGPYSDEAEVGRVRALLEAEGYQPIVRN